MSSQNKVCLSQMYSWNESDKMTDTRWLFILSYILMLDYFFRLQAWGSLLEQINSTVCGLHCMYNGTYFCGSCVIHLRVKVLDEDVIQLTYMHLDNRSWNTVTKLNYFYKLKLIQIKRIYFIFL